MLINLLFSNSVDNFQYKRMTGTITPTAWVTLGISALIDGLKGKMVFYFTLLIYHFSPIIRATIVATF